MDKISDNKVQVGVILKRDPEDRYKTIESIPIYKEATPEIRKQEEKMMKDAAKMFAEMFEKHMEETNDCKVGKLQKQLKTKPHQKLKLKLLEYEVDQAYIATLLNRGITYVSQRMTGKKSWTIEDAYKIMDEFNIPYDEMHIYFPKY